MNMDEIFNEDLKIIWSHNIHKILYDPIERETIETIMYSRTMKTGCTKHGVIFSTSESYDLQAPISQFNDITESIIEAIKNSFQSGVSNSRLRRAIDFLREKKVKTEDRNEKMKEIIINNLESISEENKKLIATHENKMKYNKRRGIIAIRQQIYKNIDVLRAIHDIIDAEFMNIKADN